jgi:hypothetical protein
MSADSRRALIGFGVVLVFGLLIGAVVSSSLSSKASLKTVTETATNSLTLTKTTSIVGTETATSFSVSQITLPQETTTATSTYWATAFRNTTTTIVEPPTTTTQTVTQTSTSTSTQMETTVIVVTQSASVSTTSGDVTTTASLANGVSSVYPGSPTQIYVTVNNGVNQILNVTFSPSVQSYNGATMSFSPSSFSKIVPPGSFVYNFSATVKSYLSQSPSVAYQLVVPETFALNGVTESIQASLSVLVNNPLTVSSFSLSGLVASCGVVSDPTSIGHYNCIVNGNPNQEGSITWQGHNYGGASSCLTWQIISPVIQVFVQNPGGYTACSVNGQNGFVAGPGAWQVAFTLGVPSSATSADNPMTFLWG